MKKLLFVFVLMAGRLWAQSGPFAPSGGSQNLILNVAGGTALVGTTPTAIPTTILTLQPNTTNYVYVDLSAGVINFNTTGFTSTTFPVGIMVTNGMQVVSFKDVRPAAWTGSGGGAPTGTAGGVLSGTYPNPGIANPLPVATIDDIANAGVVVAPATCSGVLCGSLHLEGGINSSSTASHQAGGVELEPGSATAGGTQGVLILGNEMTEGVGTVTQWNLECYTSSSAMTVLDCGANPTSFAGVTDFHTGSVTEIHIPPSETPINASGAVTLYHTVCAGSTAGQVTDSGGTGPCPASAGITVGTVIKVSGNITLPDGVNTTLSTTLPLVAMNARSQVAGGDLTSSIPSFKDYGGVGNGTSDNSTAMTAACAANSEVWLPAGAYAFTSGYAVPCALHFGAGSTLVAPTGVTVTLDGQVTAPTVQIFTTAGTGNFVFTDATSLVYPEWFGITGTADQAGINAAILAAPNSCVQFLGKVYNTSAAVNVNYSGACLLGAPSGNTAGQGSLAHYVAPGTWLKSTSTTATILSIAGGSTSTPITSVAISNINLTRTAGAGASSHGLSASYVNFLRLNNVWSTNSVYDFYFLNANNPELEYTEADETVGSGAASTWYGYYVDSSTGLTNASFGMNHNWAFNHLGSGTFTGFIASGTQLSNIFVNDLQVGFANVGVEVIATGNTGYGNNDIHFTNIIMDTMYSKGYFFSGLNSYPGALGPEIEVSGGWVAEALSGASNFIGADIETSNGVRVSNVTFVNGASDTDIGVKVNGSSNFSVVNNFFEGWATPISLIGATDGTVTANQIYGPNIASGSDLPFGTGIAITSTSIFNSVTANAINGYGMTGITADSTSCNNILYPNAIDTTNITTALTSACSSNVIASTYVPLTAGTTISLAAPAAFAVCTSTCTVTPPVPVKGYQFCVFNGDNVSTVITMAALGSSASYESTARTGYGTQGTGTLVSGGAAKDFVCIVGLDSTHYLTTSFNGTWTAD